MTDREGWQPQQGYGQQYTQEQPWQAQQYDPAAHAQRVGPGPQSESPWQQYPPQQPPYGYQQPYPGQQPRWQRQQPPQRKRHLGRKIFGGITGIIGVIIVISIAMNSGGHTVNTTGTTPTGGSSTTTAGGTGHAATPKTAGIGSAITLAGNDGGEQMAVTVTKVIRSAAENDGLGLLPGGDRLYAVQFRLTDTGSAAYSDSPSNGAAVVDSAGQSYQSGMETVSRCQAFPASENIAPGSSGLGCVVFEVSEKAKIVSVQFTLDSGFGPQTGQWNVG